MYYHLIMDLIGFNGFMSTFLGFVAYDHREIIELWWMWSMAMLVFNTICP